jgi:hypothetical protein
MIFSCRLILIVADFHRGSFAGDCRFYFSAGILGHALRATMTQDRTSETAASDQQPDHDYDQHQRYKASGGAVVTVAVVASAAAEHQNQYDY